MMRFIVTLALNDEIVIQVVVCTLEQFVTLQTTVIFFVDITLFK